MSLLINLPSDLYTDIITNWINTKVFFTFVLLDNAVQRSPKLRRTLSNHLKFMHTIKTAEDIEFDRSRGYHCTFLDQFIIPDELQDCVLNIQTIVLRSNVFIKFKLRNVTSLIVENYQYIPSEVLASLTKLEFVVWLPSVTDRTLLNVRDYCHNLTFLTLRDYGKGSAEIITKIIKNNPNLTEIDCTCKAVLPLFIKNFPNLRRLRLDFGSETFKITLKDIMKLIESKPHLVFLHLNDILNYEFNHLFLLQRPSLPWNLESITKFTSHVTEISNKNVDDAYVTELIVTSIISTNNISLQELTLFNCLNLKFRDLEKVTLQNKDLQKISMRRLPFSAHEIGSLFFGNYTSISLLLTPNIDIPCIIKILENCRKLVTFEVTKFTTSRTESPIALAPLKGTLLSYPSCLKKFALFYKNEDSVTTIVMFVDSKFKYIFGNN